MTTAGAPPLWRQIAHQTLLGKRGPAKSGTLWLPLSVVLALTPLDALTGAWLAGVALFVASSLRTVGTILANDLVDRAEDAAAGKGRWIARLSPVAGGAVVAALLALGVLVLAWFGANAGALAAFGAAVLLGLLYSLPPARLKGRGALGLLAYGVCCACAYSVLPCAWFGSGWGVLALLVLAVFWDRCVNLLFHQVMDYEADAGQLCRTYAVAVGPARARRSLAVASHLAALAIVGLGAFVATRLWPLGAAAVGVAALAAAAAGVQARAARARGGAVSPLVQELGAHYLGLTYAASWVLPPLLLAACALRMPSLWLLAGAAALSTLLTTANMVAYRHN